MHDQSRIADNRTDPVRLHHRVSLPNAGERTNDRTVIATGDPTYRRLTSMNAAVLLIDHQIGPLWELEFAETRRAVVELARLAEQLRLPTIISAIGVETWGAVIPELTDAYASAPHIVRATVNPWDESRVRILIEQSRRRKLVIAGGAGSPSVTLCALSAARAGYDVYCALDASAQLGHDAIARLAREGVMATTTSLITSEILDERAARRRAWG
jgi:isochorismatase family protein